MRSGDAARVGRITVNPQQAAPPTRIERLPTPRSCAPLTREILQHSRPLARLELLCRPRYVAVRNLLATLALALALGGVVAGQWIIFPAIDGSGPIADANLARALREPLELRLATITTLLAVLASVCLLSRADGKLPLSFTLVALTLLIINRTWILPSLHEVLQRVDLVSRLPADRMGQAGDWKLKYQIADTIAAMLLAGALLLRESLALRSLRAFAPLKKRTDQ